jgi:hypothetical protein
MRLQIFYATFVGVRISSKAALEAAFGGLFEGTKFAIGEKAGAIAFTTGL